MAGTRKKNQEDSTTELLKDLLIAELAKGGASQVEIRKIVGCDINRVSRIAKVLKKARLPAAE